MIDWIERMIKAIDAELGNATATRALLIGFVCSIGLTQLIKFASQLQPMPDREYRIAVRVFAFLAAAVPTWALWPEAGWPGVIIAVTMGLVAPGLYLLVARVLVHKWPWLDGKLSARPEGTP